MPLATMPLVERQERYDRMVHLRDKKGTTMEELGQMYGLSRSRVEQILKRPRPIRQYGGRPRKRAV